MLSRIASKRIISHENAVGRFANRDFASKQSQKLFSTGKTSVTVAHGDGIGPEITEATIKIIETAGARINWEKIEIGEKVYLEGHSSGIRADAWDSIRKNKVMLKAPITTPSGGGYKSLNVTLRKTFGLFANVRPCLSYHPFVATKHPNMTVVIFRENEEDLYAGIEHQQTNQVVQCLKLTSRAGCERIIGYAFEWARRNNRKKITAFVKDNIMKMTDGLFASVFEEIGQKYPEIQRDRMIVDIGAARLADTPEMFDVVVMPNLYGDILSDVAAQIAGSVGLGGSANIGDSVAMFEAIHGSAPLIAGKGIANPSGMLLSSVMMLSHIGQFDVAERVHNAWLSTLEDGVHTPDIFNEKVSKVRVGSEGFTKAVIERLGKRPSILQPVTYNADAASMRDFVPELSNKEVKKEMVGVDVFLHWEPKSGTPNDLANHIKSVHGGESGLVLQLITNRGVKVWPDGFPETFCIDHWRCRFKAPNGGKATDKQIISLLKQLSDSKLQFIKTENLYLFNGKPGYSLGQGE